MTGTRRGGAVGFYLRMEPLTIFRCAVLSSDDDALDYAVRELAATVERVSMDALRGRALPARARGPVLLVASDDRTSTAGLAAGVDEVLRAGEVTREALRAAIGRARLRAQVRADKSAPEGDDWAAVVVFLISALTDELREPLAVAALHHGVLDAGLPVVLGIGDELAELAAAAPETAEHRHLLARRLTAPKSAELVSTLGRLGGELVRAQWVVRLLRDVISSDAESSTVDCCVLAEQLQDCLRGQVPSLTVRAEPNSVAAVPRGGLVLVVASLVLRGLRAAPSQERQRVEIGIDVYGAEGAVVLEVHDNGGLTRADLRPDLLEGKLLETGARERSGLAALRDRVRAWGGELLVDTDVLATTVRLILPRAQDTANAGLSHSALPARRNWLPD